MNRTKKLTTKENWDKVWKEHSLPQVINIQNDPYYVKILDDFFHKYLPKNNDFEFLELGCAPGRWLHYFHKEFGYKISGLDSSSIGFELTKKNLEILNVKANLYFDDILFFNSDKKFDVVFSFGLIEHFDPPTEIIDKHIESIKPNGYLIIGVPNIKKAIYGPLQAMINRENLKGYIHISDKKLANYFNEKDFKIIFCGYLGVLNLYLLNIPQKNSILYKIIALTQTALDKLLRLFQVKRETKIFSPYIFIICKKYERKR